MAGNDGWEDVTDPAELHAYASANLPRAPGSRGKAPAQDPTGDMLETATDRDKARSAVDLIARVKPQLDRVEQLYNQNLRGNSTLHGAMEYLPTPGNKAFDTAVDELAKLVRPATRTTGEGAMSDFESKLALRALPNRWNFDASNEEAIGGLRRFLESNEQAYAKRLGLPQAPPPAQRAPAQKLRLRLDENGRIIQ